jgi:hypothetical protein
MAYENMNDKHSSRIHLFGIQGAKIEAFYKEELQEENEAE